MKTKVFSILLCLCLLIPCFTILGFAEGGEVVNASVSSEDIYVPEDLYQMIDVQAYIDNAGQAGYDEMKLLGFSEPDLIYVRYDDFGELENPYYSWGISVYIYNPIGYEFIITSYDYYSDPVGYARVKDIDDSEAMTYPMYASDPLIDYDQSGSMTNYVDDLFLKFSISGSYSELSYESNPVSQGQYFIEGFELHHIAGSSENDHVIKVDDINVNIDYYDIKYSMNFSSAYTDLTTFLDTDIDTLKKEYPKKPDYSEITPAFLYEDLSNKRLFLYMYDSRGRGAVNNSVNRVSLSTDNSNFESYYLQFINFENTLSKFEIKGVSDLFANVSTESTRTYYINEVVYDRLVGSYGVTTDKAQYTYTTDAVGELNVASESNMIRLKDVGNTFYRLNSSANGDNLYQTLSSVYFSIPESYFELDDADYLNDRHFTKVTGSYNYGIMNPGIVVSNKALEEEIKNNYLNGTKLNSAYMIDSVIDAGSVTMNVYSDLYLGYKEEDNNKIWSEKYYLSQDRPFPYKGYYEDYSVLFYVEEFGDPASLLIDGIKLKTALLNSENPFSEYYTDVPFELTDKVVYNLLSVKELTVDEFYVDHSWLETLFVKWFGYSDELQDSVKNIKLFQTLEGEKITETLELSKDEFISTYLVSSDKYNDICDKMRYAYENNEVFVLIRFDTYDYFADYAHEVNRLGAYEAEDDIFLFIDKYYEDFKFLQFELTNSYDSKVYNVDMSPISFIAGVTTPDPFDMWEDTNVPDINDFFLLPIKDTSNVLLMVLGTVLIIILAIVIVKFVLVPIIKAIKK